MKIVLFSINILCCASFFSQTAIISAKSHSGNSEHFQEESAADNFGGIPVYIKTVELLPGRCIVETPNYGESDTVCDHPYFNKNLSLEEIKSYYGRSTTFIGFENYQPTPTPKIGGKRQRENNLIILFVIAAGLSAIFSLKRIFVPVHIKKES